MSTKPYFKYYIGDYLADTAHMSTIEHGAYHLLMLSYYYTKSPIPDDDKRLATITKMSLKGYRRIKSTLSQKFTVKDGFWYHNRIEKELIKYEENAVKKRLAGQIGSEKRWKNSDSICHFSVIAEPLKNHSKSEVRRQKTEESKEKNIMSGKPDPDPKFLKNQELKKQAVEILDFLNLMANRKYRPVKTNLKLIMARLSSGADFQDCKSMIARKVSQWGKDSKMVDYLRPKTLFNETNFEQYIGELVEEHYDVRES